MDATMFVENPVRNVRKAAISMRSFKHLFLIAMMSLPMTSCASADCELHNALSRAPSPDGKWVATFFDNVCGAGFVTNSFSSVELTLPNEPNSRDPSDVRTVFAMDDLVDPKIAAVTWTGSRTLQVTIPNDAWIGEQKSTFADVAISYKYVPDDPIERECLNRLRSLSIKKTYEELQKQDRDADMARCRAEGGPKPPLQ